MCGIAGIIHRGRSSNVGFEMTAMLSALKHRGPDSSGFAVYGKPKSEDFLLRIKVAEQEDMSKGHSVLGLIEDRTREIDRLLLEHGAKIKEQTKPTPYAHRYVISSNHKIEEMARHIEEIDGVEILSLGNRLELIKDLGDATVVSKKYGLDSFEGTHAIGHTRMATESDVDIRSAHPHWALPYKDISVVHNGQITNYWMMRREMERTGHRFLSDCDSELLAVYTAHNLANGLQLEDSLKQSVEEIDGVFTYLVATQSELGMAKDSMAAKPLVLFEGENLIAMASEEVAIRSIFPEEIDTYDPYDEEVRVWKA